ncbi:MAG: hypothetical protein JWP12_2876 [Bacteroidetes bacterium]|nr:hypothetical protein [Bacteroidota bacterium]
MATGNVYVTVVDVGQGQCTFVEIYDDDGIDPKLIHTLLFDCGSDKRSDETYKNLDYIVTKVGMMDAPGFDCIFFSHSDKDHISLMRYVLDEIGKTVAKPFVKKVIYGGAWRKYTKGRSNILDYMVDDGFCSKKADVISIPSNSSNYDPPSKAYNGNLWESDDAEVVVYKIAANVLSNEPDWEDNAQVINVSAPEALNRVSLIAALYYAGKSVVICGDATNITMSAVIKRFGNSDNNKDSLFKNNIMTTLPHHGSRVTGFDVKAKQQVGLMALLIVQGFADLLRSQTITISAYSKHRHPSLYLMGTFLPVTKVPLLADPRLEQENTHRLTANIDYELKITYPVEKNIPREKKDETFETKTNTFSTFYNNGASTFAFELDHLFAQESKGVVMDAGAINKFACWGYLIPPAGDMSLSGYANLTIPLTSFTEAPVDLLTRKKNLAALLTVAAAQIPARIQRRKSTQQPLAQRISPLYPRLKQFH